MEDPTPQERFYSVQDRYKGIGGWLLLVAFGLIVTPFRLGWSLLTELLPIFETDTWAKLNTPTSDSYHPLLMQLIMFEAAGSATFMSASVVLLVLFFCQLSVVPRLMIGFFALNGLMVATDCFVVSLIPSIQMDPDMQREIARGAFNCLVWIPYFCVSERVKATFTR